jgi:CheY-like chemotaxis protein
MMADNIVLDALGIVYLAENRASWRLVEVPKAFGEHGGVSRRELPGHHWQWATHGLHRICNPMGHTGWELQLDTPNIQTSGYAARTAPKHILLVDDDDGYRYAAQKALEAAGFAVFAASGFNDALQRLESLEPIDLMVVDIVMKVNGFALARMARYRRPALKTLHITAFDVPGGEAEGKLILKPAAMDDLVREVHAAVADDLPSS